MAKKNSTKTATKEALQASEPRLQQFSQWKGINFSLAPHSWSDSPYDVHDPSVWPDGDHHNQSDLPANYFMVQNNIRMEDNGSVETRNESLSISDSDIIAEPLSGSGRLFTGVNHLCGDKLFAAVTADENAENQSERIFWLNVGSEVILDERSNSASGVSEPKSQDITGDSSGVFSFTLSVSDNTQYVDKNSFNAIDNITLYFSSNPGPNSVIRRSVQSAFAISTDTVKNGVTLHSDISVNNASSIPDGDPFSVYPSLDGEVFVCEDDFLPASSPTTFSINLSSLTIKNYLMHTGISNLHTINQVKRSNIRLGIASSRGRLLEQNGVLTIASGRDSRSILVPPSAIYHRTSRPDDSSLSLTSVGSWWIEDLSEGIIAIKISNSSLIPQNPSATDYLETALLEEISSHYTDWYKKALFYRKDSRVTLSLSKAIRFATMDGETSITLTISTGGLTNHDDGRTGKITWKSIGALWHQVIVEKALDRDLTKPIVWDSINDVLGDLICFGHYVDNNGNNIYNIYRQIEDSEHPNDITIKAYAAIPDPNKELYISVKNYGSTTRTTLKVSDCRIGFMKMPDSESISTEPVYEFNGSGDTNYPISGENWQSGYYKGGYAGSAKPTAMYQYFRCTADPVTGIARGTGTYGNKFVNNAYDKNASIRWGSYMNRLTLPATKITTEENGQSVTTKYSFQNAPLALWGPNRDTSQNPIYDSCNWQVIMCNDADGETHLKTTEGWPEFAMFPIVVGSKMSGSWGSNTLRVVDPIDANWTNSNGEPAGGVDVFANRSSYTAGDDYWARYSFCYVYTNPLGHTLASQWRTVYANLGAEDLSTATGAFRITQWVPENDELHDYDSITGVDIFYTKDDYKTMAFAGHVDFPGGSAKNLVGRQWVYDWYGASSDTTEWSNAGLTLPDENTTRGPECEWMDYIDNKCYFYGGDKKYRLYIGGRVGHELCTTASVGGGWLDINPGSGVELKKVLKFKTYNGANIVTILASHANHRHVRRYNLIQNNIAITNELTRQGYAYEEVSNVVGAISHWGAGVWAEGLYTLSRYGLCLTTQQMENTNNLRAQVVSEPISPIFTEGIAANMHRSEMIFSNDKVYFVLSTHDLKGEVLDPSEIIFCYDVNAKGWYTYTLDGETNILSVFNFDYEGNKEGIGVITPTKIYLIPNAGIEDNAWPTPANKNDFVFHTDRSILETGELALRTPPSTYQTLSQLEFRFDYFIGDVTIDVTGVDYYGRHFNVQKEVHEHDLVTEYPVYVRVDKLLQTYNVRIEGYAHYRLTHILTKTYSESNKIDLVYGFDSDNRYEARQKYCYIDGVKTKISTLPNRQYGGTEHHYIDSYNNLRECIVP